MMSPVDMHPIIITQGFHAKHEAVDIRNYDRDNNKFLHHRAIEKSRILEHGVGKKYKENYILLLGLESGYYWLYCHNTPMVPDGVIVDAGLPFGRPDLSGDGNTGYHLHLELHRRGRKTERINPLVWFADHGLEYKYK